MAWASRILGGVAIAMSLMPAGCTAGRTAGTGGPGPGTLLAKVDSDSQPRLARSQQPEPAPPFKPAASLSVPVSLPPVQPGVLPAGNPLLSGSTTIGVQQAAALLESSKERVKVRAWVNGRPIFDEELVQVAGPYLREVSRLPEPQRTEKMTELVGRFLNQLIDQEVMYQDAVKKLEKNNPRALDKLKEFVEQDYDKQVKKLREAGVSEEQITETAHIARRMLERSNISMEYARTRIMPYVQQQVTLDEVRAYYDTHMNEFQTVDKVQWQDVFIAVGPKHPTPADTRRFAQELIAKCRTADDFAKLVTYDDGDSQFRGGEGFGQRRGEIRPPEVESHLFQLKEGQVGPIVELPTGVHIFRLVKREYAGQLPLNEQTQKSIRKKLEGQVAEREYNQLVRSLRDRSVIRIVREAP
jgi:parvulin-like peptidyl-prolyl isomerase